MRPSLFNVSTCLLLGFALSLSHCASAQVVFKCVIDGKVTYQSSTCTGQGTALTIKPGPSDDVVREAQNRAMKEATLSSTFQAQAEQRERQQQFRPVARQVDCAKLATEYGTAYGWRNGALRNARSSGGGSAAFVKSQDDAVINAENRIQQIESDMRRGGCHKPD